VKLTVLPRSRTWQKCGTSHGKVRYLVRDSDAILIHARCSARKSPPTSPLGLSGYNLPPREERQRTPGLHRAVPRSTLEHRPEHPFCFFCVAWGAQRTDTDEHSAVWDDCLNGIKSICLYAEWPASTSQRRRQAACGEAECTVPSLVACSASSWLAASPVEEYRLPRSTKTETKKIDWLIVIIT
jgi:hypothetical protein